MFVISLNLLMCIMEKDRKKKFDSDFLSNSYRDGIERVLGVKGHVTYDLPPETIKRRQIFWDNFFLQYSEQLSDDIELDVRTLKLCSTKCKSVAVRKDKSIVQYWVNTGYLPYQMSIHKIGHLENNHFSIEREVNTSYTKPHCNESSLSSSVDTAAYILSNINTTNKADTMAIIEGAKHDNLENLCDTTPCENTEIAKVADDVMHENNAENNIRDNNNSNSQQHSPVTSEIMTRTMPQQNIDTQGNVDILNQTLNTKSPSTNNCKFYSSELPNDISTPVHSKESYLRRSLLDCSATKRRHRKRLYCGRDSPVDLITMEHSHKKILSKLTKHIHPALDFKYPLQKQTKIRKKRSFKRYMVNKSLINSTLSTSDSKKSDEVENNRNYSKRLSSKLNDLEKLVDTPCTNRETLTNSDNIQDINKCNENRSINMSLSNQPISTNHEQNNEFKNNELNNSITQSENVITRASDEFSNRFEQLTNSNSMIPKVDDRKHQKKSNKVEKDHKNLNPVVVLTRLSTLDIQKHRKLKNYLHNLHPVVGLKQLSESEIQKYKRPTNMIKDAKYLNAVVRLKRLSEATVKKYKTTLNTNTQSKTDLLSDTVQLSDNSVNRSRFSLRNKANGLKSPSSIINLGNSDTDSNQSTLLVYKCSSKTSDTLSLSNVSESSKKLAGFCSNSGRLKLSKINKNLTLRKDVTDKQSIDNTLNTSINSKKHICNISSSRESKTSKNGYSDNVHATIGKKIKSHLDGLVNPKHRRRSGKKLNVTKKQNNNGYNNLIEGSICDTTVIGKSKSEKQAVVKGLIEALCNGKTKKNKNKFNTNYLHFETKLYDSDSELTSDSEILSYLYN